MCQQHKPQLALEQVLELEQVLMWGALVFGTRRKSLGIVCEQSCHMPYRCTM
jgi:hypothetical protein